MKLCSILLIFFSTYFSHGQIVMDKIDAYQLTINKTFLFGTFKDFTETNGIPTIVSVGENVFKISKIEDVVSAINTPINSLSIISLKYEGIDMWYLDGDLLPFTIDFRKTKQKVVYKGQYVFDPDFSFEEFKKVFPKSATEALSPEMSLYHTISKDNSTNWKSFILKLFKLSVLF
jgi:hypothetical protein